MKKLICILIVLVFSVMLLAACGGGRTVDKEYSDGEYDRLNDQIDKTNQELKEWKEQGMPQE